MNSKRELDILSRRRFLAVIASGSGALILAACGGGSTPSTNTSGANPAATAAPADSGGAAEAATPAPADAAAGPTAVPTPTPAVLGTGSQKVTFWHGLAGADGATFLTMLTDYASKKPDVTISSELFSNWNDFYQKLPTATAAGTPPDLGIMHSWAIKQFADQGILQDADALFFTENRIPKADFNPGLIEAITVDGKTQAVPFDNHGWLNWVNTKVIKDAGLDPEKIPTNGTEFIEWAQKIVVDDAGKHPNEDGFNPDRVKIWATHSSWQRFSIVSTVWQFGGNLIGDDGKTSQVNSEQTVAALQYWVDLITKYHVVPPAVPGVAAPPDLFKSNSIALMWDGTWSLNFFKDNPEANEVMKPMYINSLAPDGKKAVRFDSHMLIVPNGVADQKLNNAKDLIQWLSDNGETWATSGQVPARLSVQNKPTVQNIPSGKAAAAQFLEIGRPGQSHKSINEIVTAYEAAFSAALAGTTPAKAALDEAQTQVQAILDRG